MTLDLWEPHRPLMRSGRGDPWEPILESIVARPSTAFRAGYLQFSLSAWKPFDAVQVWEEWVSRFRSRLPRPAKGARYRLALVEARGDVIRIDP